MSTPNYENLAKYYPHLLKNQTNTPVLSNDKKNLKEHTEDEYIEFIIKNKPSATKVRKFYRAHINALNEEHRDNTPFKRSFNRKCVF
jgi:hypothetical protein